MFTLLAAIVLSQLQDQLAPPPPPGSESVRFPSVAPKTPTLFIDNQCPCDLGFYYRPTNSKAKGKWPGKVIRQEQVSVPLDAQGNYDIILQQQTPYGFWLQAEAKDVDLRTLALNANGQSIVSLPFKVTKQWQMSNGRAVEVPIIANIIVNVAVGISRNALIITIPDLFKGVLIEEPRPPRLPGR